MGALSDIVASISEDVVAALALAGYPPLTPDASGNAGKILFGSAAMYEATAPPRIVFEPVGSKFGAAEYASSSSTLNTLERKNQRALRTIAAEDIQINIRCWGASPTGDIVDDYDVTRALYHQVRASMQKLIPGAFAVEESGKYTDGSNVNRSGREFVFGCTLLTPVLSALAPYAVANETAAQRALSVDNLYAPPSVVGSGGITIQHSSGSPNETITVLTP